MKSIKIDLQYHGFGVDFKVNTDKKRVQQILLNILSNAVKFTDRNGKILILIEFQIGGKIRISVTDSGIGIKK
jgi:signal transduction histidine kinase